MKRISSSSLFLAKKVFPVVLFSGLLFLLILVVFFPTEPMLTNIFAAVVIVVTAGFSYFLFRHYLFGLADEVVDSGDSLTIRYGTEEETILLVQISHISYAVFPGPPRVTLSLQGDSRFGSEISFWPKRSSLIPILGENEVVEELRARIGQNQLSS